MIIEFIKPGQYPCIIDKYNTKRSSRTGFTYLNLKLIVEVKDKEFEFEKSYCLSAGKNYDIVRILENIGAFNNGKANFKKLLNYEFVADLSYNDYGYLIVTAMDVASEIINDEEYYEEEEEEEEDVD